MGGQKERIPIEEHMMKWEKKLGKWLYNIATGENNLIRGFKEEWKIQTPKEKAKDKIFIFSIVGLWIFMIWLVGSEYAHAIPYFEDPAGNKVYGNCSFIYTLFQANSEYNKNLKPYQMPELVNPNQELVEYDPQSTSTSTTTSTTTTLKACPLCPPCSPCICETIECPGCPPEKECYTKTETKDIIYRLRPTAESPAYQNGFYDMRKNCLQALGGNVSRFREGPSHTHWKLLSGIGEYVGEPDDSFCFRPTGDYSFILNRTFWGWNDERCKTSSLEVTRLR
jgi:hypothetical protein